MWSLIIVVFAIILIYILLKVYFEKYDCVIAYTGGLGSGKSFKGVQQSCKLLKRNRLRVKFDNFKVRIYNIFHKEKKTLNNTIPLLYSNIPIFIKQKSRKFKTYNVVELKYDYRLKNGLGRYVSREYAEYKKIEDKYIKRYIESSIELTEQHLLLQEKQNIKSITFIDEIGGFANQYEYNNPNIVNAFDEYIRLYRHYTKGGYFICTEQCSDGICKPIRVRLNKVFNLMNFKSYFNLIYKVQIRELSVSEDIKTIEEMNKEDNMKTTWGLFPRRRKYDTYCYSERYKSVPNSIKDNFYTDLKKYSLMKVSKVKVVPKTTNKKVG